MTAAELILYATPTGELADACERFFAAASDIGPTTAQTYPPHCTLTGFFRRPQDRVEFAIAEIKTMLADWGAVPDDAVTITALTRSDEWIGFELRSPWLISLTAAVVGHHRMLPGEDALRPKDWLHLSLAYGETPSLCPYGDLVDRMGLDHTLPGSWEVAVWQREPSGNWHRH